MTYEPRYTITPTLLATVEEIAALRQRIQDASVEVAWIPALQKDSRTRNAHASTAIEGNPLTLAEVRALADEGRTTSAVARSQREIVNYFAGLRYVEQHVARKHITTKEVCALHRVLATGVMDQGFEGEYRTIELSVGAYFPPKAAEVPALMDDLLAWWNGPSAGLSPVMSSAVLHYRFEAIHPFGDVNGRVGRALALWELYRRGFDTHHIFSVDEYYWDDRRAYYAALAVVHDEDEDLTSWLESPPGPPSNARARVDAHPIHRASWLPAALPYGSAGAAAAVAEREREHGSARHLGCTRRLAGGGHEDHAAAASGRRHQEGRHQEERPLRAEGAVNGAGVRSR